MLQAYVIIIYTIIICNVCFNVKVHSSRRRLKNIEKEGEKAHEISRGKERKEINGWLSVL